MRPFFFCTVGIAILASACGRTGLVFYEGEETSSSGADDTAGDPSCATRPTSITPLPAELMLLLDRSGSMSMTANLHSSDSKWQEITTAIDEIVVKTQATVSWGLKMFPGNAVCQVGDGVEVPSAVDNHGPIVEAVRTTSPVGRGTPTAAAVHKTVAYLKAVTTASPKYIVLATDGQPNCANGKGADVTDSSGAVAAVAAARAAGFPTFVVGIAINDGADMTLNQMATAGGVPRAGETKYYATSSRQDFIDAMKTITRKVNKCGG